MNPKLLLDSNIIIHYLQNQPLVHQNVLKNRKRIALCAPVVAEVYRGILSSSFKVKAAKMTAFHQLIYLFPVLAFDTTAAKEFGNIHNEHRHAGRVPSGDQFDLAVASIARYHGLIVITDNTKHFARIRRLKVVNWLDR